ncbi:MAG: hypothetical protein M3033_02115 [Acidobacteriota bacterium]|nr:hypothetical protein [Acidobacteriota bacterium]
MPDERDVAHDKKVLDEHAGEKLEIIGEHPEHAVQPGRKTPQEHIDKDAIDESGNRIYDDGKDENDAK